MDNLLFQQPLDVFGLVGFEQEMGATSSLDSDSQASNNNHTTCLFQVCACMQERLSACGLINQSNGVPDKAGRSFSHPRHGQLVAAAVLGCDWAGRV